MPGNPLAARALRRSGLVLAVVLLISCTEDSSRNRSALETVEPARLLAELEPFALDLSHIVSGQTVYVPCYSQVLAQSVPGDERRRPLAVSLSLRNTDGEHPIVIRSARYYASDGTLLRDFVSGGPVAIGSMGTVTQPIAQLERAGGEGANFVVEWVSLAEVTAPIFEAVMVSSAGTSAMAFTSRGRAIAEFERGDGDR